MIGQPDLGGDEPLDYGVRHGHQPSRAVASAVYPKEPAFMRVINFIISIVWLQFMRAATLVENHHRRDLPQEGRPVRIWRGHLGVVLGGICLDDPADDFPVRRGDFNTRRDVGPVLRWSGTPRP
jgi:hypothetical protein